MGTGKNRLWDTVGLVVTALVVCVLGLSSMIGADIYHISEIWPAMAWFSVLFIPTIAPTFRDKALWKRPSFLLFFVLWMIAHAVIVACLIKWVALLYWFPLICLEAFVGYLIAHTLFGVLPSSQDEA